VYGITVFTPVIQLIVWTTTDLSTPEGWKAELCVVNYVVFFYLYGGVKLEEAKHSLHVNKGLPRLTVDGAEKIERNGQLEQQTVHHHQITHRHCSYTRTHTRHSGHAQLKYCWVSEWVKFNAPLDTI